MLTRLSLVLTASLALATGQPAGASPITYAFTGTLNDPLDGASQFNGSFTINGDPTLVGFRPTVTEGGSDVSLTLKIGDQEFHFINQAGLVDKYATFVAGPEPGVYGSPRKLDEAFIAGSISSMNGSHGASFGMTFYSDAASDLVGNLRNLRNLRDFNYFLGSSSVRLSLDLKDGTSDYSTGRITSIALMPAATPEPSTLAIFAVLGITELARRRRS